MRIFLIPAIMLLSGLAAGAAAAWYMAPVEPSASRDRSGTGPVASTDGRIFVKLHNQFVIPVVSQAHVRSMVVATVSLETLPQYEMKVSEYEPLLRAEFLQVFFDHANAGGFDGYFTGSAPMGTLREALKNTAQIALPGMVSDVLITDIVRQDV